MVGTWLAGLLLISAESGNLEGCQELITTRVRNPELQSLTSHCLQARAQRGMRGLDSMAGVQSPTLVRIGGRLEGPLIAHFPCLGIWDSNSYPTWPF